MSNSTDVSDLMGSAGVGVSATLTQQAILSRLKQTKTKIMNTGMTTGMMNNSKNRSSQHDVLEALAVQSANGRHDTYVDDTITTKRKSNIFLLKI